MDTASIFAFKACLLSNLSFSLSLNNYAVSGESDLVVSLPEASVQLIESCLLLLGQSAFESSEFLAKSLELNVQRILSLLSLSSLSLLSNSGQFGDESVEVNLSSGSLLVVAAGHSKSSNCKASHK